mmetsp:Transcript_27946/g.39354  ORF Transcript_27946/g.39354 Transcript_27946/m.39354 type:complete len:513 (-) Transcript_27946:1117-2655(-)
MTSQRNSEPAAPSIVMQSKNNCKAASEESSVLHSSERTREMSDENDAIISWFVNKEIKDCGIFTLTNLQKELGMTKQTIILANIVMMISNADDTQQHKEGWNHISKHHQERFEKFQFLYNQKSIHLTSTFDNDIKVQPLRLSPRMMIQNETEQELLKQQVFQFLEGRANRAQQQLEHVLQLEEAKLAQEQKKKKKAAAQKRKKKNARKKKNKKTNNSSVTIEKNHDIINSSQTICSSSSSSLPSSENDVNVKARLFEDSEIQSLQPQDNITTCVDESSSTYQQQKENISILQNRLHEQTADNESYRNHHGKKSYPIVQHQKEVKDEKDTGDKDTAVRMTETNDATQTTVVPLSPTKKCQSEDKGVVLLSTPIISTTRTPPTKKKTATPLSSPTIHNSSHARKLSQAAASIGTTLEDIEQNEQVQILLRAQRREHLEMIQQVQLKAFIAETQAAAAVDRAKQVERLLVDTLLKQAMDEIIDSILIDDCIDSYFGVGNSRSRLQKKNDQQQTPP